MSTRTQTIDGKLCHLATKVVVFNPNYNGVLWLLREPHVMNGNKWGLPGGRYDLTDASFEQVGKRETKEETGIDIEHLTLLGNVEQPYKGINWFARVYAAIDNTPLEHIALSEELDKSYFTFDEMAKPRADESRLFVECLRQIVLVNEDQIKDLNRYKPEDTHPELYLE